jgi:nifR3 family TIM-barrel protein
MNKIYPENSVVLAPLSGFSDLPYRRSARRHGCEYAFTEMVDAGSLVYRNVKTIKMLERGDDEPWLGLQLVAADKDILKKAALIVNERNFDVIDFNLGCPAPKVVRKGEGAALGEKIDEAVFVFEVLMRSSQIPVTAKIRILDEDDPAPTVELATKLYNAGAKAITVHGRVRTKFYSGPVFHDIISAVRDAVGCQVIANGSVFDFDSFCEIRRNTGCDSVMVARGAMGNPWIFDEIATGLKEEAESGGWIPPSSVEFSAEVFQHISEMAEFYGLELGLKIARKIVLDYMRGRGFARVLKTKVIEIATINDLKEFTDQLSTGPTGRYKHWLEQNPDAVRRLR